jgi:hypothetical protein
MKYRDRTILLPGDAEKQVAYQMHGENEQAVLHADVLKVGHHGSKNSTIPEFLGAVAPKTSIISAGEENWASQPGTSGAAGGKRHADFQDGPGWSGANVDGWGEFAGESFSGLRRGGRGFSEDATTRGEPNRQAIG